ncbi:hypothetical protein BDY19DRAFT_914626 [Irpex rosettiformis]|uniref:Uncharacterized protein n=1 Tax=Irpex rosettiformis TaxID=378272 RepID=A0ACB8UKG4_9APHY|nr:hypothetical protein BDY19DRAFT_914626 [Irpex rosettiformis]
MSNNNLNGLSNPNGLQMALQIAGALIQGAQGTPQQTTRPQPHPQPPATDLLSLLSLQQQTPSTHTNNTGGSGSGSFSQNALNIGPPVGAYPNDEELLVQALCDSEEKGWTYRRALEGLHGVHDHLASQWKDYYLDNAQRLNKRVDFMRGQNKRDKPLITVKKPAFDSPTKSRESSITAHKSTHTVAKQQPPTQKSAESAMAGPSRAKGKTKDVTPRRSPTPPTDSDAQEFRGGKFRFTDKENKYMVKYARYRFSLDPDVSKSAICHALAKKVPHHSFASWLGHWQYMRDELERRLPQFRAPQDVGAVDDGELYTDDDSDFQDGLGSDSDSEADIQNMGDTGSSITRADKRVVAKYAASFGREWATMRANERWEPFEAMYPQRKSKSWGEIYRRYEKELEPMIKKYRKRRLAEVKTQQTGRPSWAHKNPDSPNTKRTRLNYDEGDDDGDYPVSKRAK